jgi:MFS family permease
MGWMIQWVTITWMMVEIDGRPEMIGLVQACLSIPVIFFAMPAGALSDLFGRKAIVVPAQMLIVLVVVLLVYLISSRSLDVPWLLALAFVLGGARASVSPAWQSYVSHIVPKLVIRKAVSLNSVGFNLARTLGPAVGGLTLGVLGPALTLAVSGLLSSFLLGFGRKLPRRRGRRVRPAQIWRSILASVVYAWNDHVLRDAYVTASLFNFSGIVIISLMPLLAASLLEAGSTVYGLLMGVFGAGAIFGAFVQTKFALQIDLGVYIKRLFRVFALSLAVMFLVDSVVTTVVGIFVSGSCWLMLHSSLSALIQTHSKERYRSRCQALFQFMIFGGNGIGALVWGVVAGSFTVTAAFGVSALTIFVGSFYVFYSTNRARKSPPSAQISSALENGSPE